MNHILRDLLVCVALTMVLAGAWLVHPAAALILGGGVLFAVVRLLSRGSEEDTET